MTAHTANPTVAREKKNIAVSRKKIHPRCYEREPSSMIHGSRGGSGGWEKCVPALASVEAKTYAVHVKHGLSCRRSASKQSF